MNVRGEYVVKILNHDIKIEHTDISTHRLKILEIQHILNKYVTFQKINNHLHVLKCGDNRKCYIYCQITDTQIMFSVILSSCIDLCFLSESTVILKH